MRRAEWPRLGSRHVPWMTCAWLLTLKRPLTSCVIDHSIELEEVVATNPQPERTYVPSSRYSPMIVEYVP